MGIDINPSIELGVNYFDRVVSAEGDNADGQDILSETNVVGMSYEEALVSLNDSLTNKGYLTADAAVAVTVMCDDDSRCSNLEETSQRCFSSAGQGVYCSRATSTEHHEAHKAGLGMGKYLAWRSLVDTGVDISADDVAHMTMSELRALAAQEGVAIEARQVRVHRIKAQRTKARQLKARQVRVPLIMTALTIVANISKIGREVDITMSPTLNEPSILAVPFVR